MTKLEKRLLSIFKRTPKFHCNHYWVNIYPNQQVFHCMYCHRDLFTDDRGFLISEPTDRKQKVRINNLELEFFK